MSHLAWRSFARSKKLSVGRSVIGAVSLLVVVGCEKTSTDLSFREFIGHVVVQGTTTEADGSPVSGAAVAPLDTFTHDCTTEFSSFLDAEPPVALSDADGFFQLRLVTAAGAGLHCLGFAATHPDNIQVDTLRNIEAPFQVLAQTPDTVFLQVVFGG